MTKQRKSEVTRVKLAKLREKREAIYAQSKKFAFGSPERDALSEQDRELLYKELDLNVELLVAIAREAGGIENLAVETVMEFSYDVRRKWRIREMRAAGITTVGDALKADIWPGTYLYQHFIKLEEMLKRARYVVVPTRTGRRLVRKPKWYFERR